MNEAPWMLDKAIEFIDGILKKEFDVFEWGSGGSTLYFSKRVKSVVSVENDQDWFNNMGAEIKNQGINNVNLIYANYDRAGNPKDLANPDAYLSGSRYYYGKVFEKYTKTIDSFGNFDLVLVDGRARSGCAKHGMSKLKDNGFLIVDDSERAHYSVIDQIIPKSWKRTILDGIKGSCYVKTSIYQKV